MCSSDLPLLLPLMIVPQPFRPGGWIAFGATVKLIALTTIGLNFGTAGTYLLTFWDPSRPSPYANARNINGTTDRRDLRSLIAKIAAARVPVVSLALPSTFENVWVADELRGFHVQSLSHNMQVLDEVGYVEDACQRLPPDRKSTRLNSSHTDISRMPSSA